MNKVWTMCKNKVYIWGNPAFHISTMLFPLCHFLKIIQHLFISVKCKDIWTDSKWLLWFLFNEGGKGRRGRFDEFTKYTSVILPSGLIDWSWSSMCACVFFQCVCGRMCTFRDFQSAISDKVKIRNWFVACFLVCHGTNTPIMAQSASESEFLARLHLSICPAFSWTDSSSLWSI